MLLKHLFQKPQPCRFKQQPRMLLKGCLAKERKEEKVLNDLLIKLPESTYIETTDIERLINHEQEANKSRFKIFEDFAQSVRTTCVM